MPFTIKKLEQIFMECGYSECHDFNKDTLCVSKKDCLDIQIYEEPLVLTGWMFQVGEIVTPSVLDAVRLSEGEIK